jgi:hypothetical protein
MVYYYKEDVPEDVDERPIRIRGESIVFRKHRYMDIDILNSGAKKMRDDKKSVRGPGSSESERAKVDDRYAPVPRMSIMEIRRQNLRLANIVDTSTDIFGRWSRVPEHAGK